LTGKKFLFIGEGEEMTLIALSLLFVVILVLFVVAGIIVALLVWGGRRDRGNQRKNLNRSLSSRKIDQFAEKEVTGIERIEIGTANTEVNMAESDAGNLKVHFYGEASAADEKDLPKLVLEASGGVISIRIDAPEQGYSQTKLDLEIPKGYKNPVVVNTASGGISLRNLTLKGLHAGAASGGITAEGLKAEDVSFKTASGSIKVQNIEAGSLVLGTSSGSIHAENVAGPIDAHSASGSVSIKLDSLKGPIKAGSTSGSVDLLLPHDASFKVRAHAVSGSISSGFPFNVAHEPGSKRMEGENGNGEFPVELESVSGSIHLRKKIV